MNKQTDIIRDRGKNKEVNIYEIDDTKTIIEGKFLKTAKLMHEWYDSVKDPENVVEFYANNGNKIDIFTFIQRLPDLDIKYPYYSEMDNVAAIPLKDYDYWLKDQIRSHTRNHFRKSVKSGVIVKEVEFSDNLITGIQKIYNETPIRQGKLFWHYNKSFSDLKNIHITFLDRSLFIGAYFENELIGFIKIVYAGSTARIMHIISMIKHRDKAPTNALIAKAVELSCERNKSFLVYDIYDYMHGGSETLLKFKQNNGFLKYEIPRYYIPLSIKGKLALRLKLHNGLTPYLPDSFYKSYSNIRQKYYQRKFKNL
jgi:antitoxin component YwqK of YwqJK toxin-antitoxin module